MSAYDEFNSIEEAVQKYRRVRTVKYFILADGSKDNPDCVCCRRPIFDFSGTDSEGKPMHPVGYQGNRCEYNPRTKRVIARHYTCAWGRTLDAVAKLGRTVR